MAIIPRPATAFPLSSGIKRPRIKEDGFLAFLRDLPCVNCQSSGASDPAHIRFTALSAGKPQTGAGTKPDDRWATPLCRRCHEEQHHHRGGEVSWWRGLIGIDPIYVAALLYSHYKAGDREAAVLVISNARILGRYS